MQPLTALITGQQVAALNWSPTRDSLRLLFAMRLFSYVACYVSKWQRAPLLPEVEQTGGLAN